MTTDLLRLERRDQDDETGVVGNNEVTIAFTPPIDEDYWQYRVAVSEGQAIVGFPKFGTIGIGFAVEEDWNTNLPYRSCSAKEIFDHISHNKGDDRIPDELCLRAIQMIREAAASDLGTGLDA